MSATSRGQGIGAILMAAMGRECVSRRCSWLEASVLRNNEPAFKFYTKQGAQQHAQAFIQVAWEGSALGALRGRQAAGNPILDGYVLR